jgi:hypothetical protein
MIPLNNNNNYLLFSLDVEEIGEHYSLRRRTGGV